MTVDNKLEPKKVEFCSVPCGEVFMYDDRYYLAVDDIEDSRGNEKNAIDLDDGEATTFDSDDEVVWVKATLVIENR